MLFGAQEHPEILQRVHKTGERLPTPMALLPSLGFGLDAFIEPALLPASPWLVGMNAIRAGGQIVVMYGQAVSGWTANQADSLLELLRGRSPLAWIPPRPDASNTTSEAWLRWWVGRLNDVLGVALDVSRFLDSHGNYDPGLHLGYLASLERLFASVQSVLAGALHPQGRVERMFDVVDLLSGMSFGGWESMLRPDSANRQLRQLADSLPPTVRDLALTRCTHAVTGLRSLAGDFGPLTAEGLLNIPQSDGLGIQDVTTDAATHTYLRLLRNAGTHSFRRAVRDPHRRAVLAAHDGDVPDAIADLALFHLLRFMIQPRAPMP